MMKKIPVLILILFMSIQSFAQTYEKPKFKETTASKNVEIVKVVVDYEGTKVFFKYTNKSNNRFDIWLNNPGHSNAMYLNYTYHNGFNEFDDIAELKFFKGITNNRYETYVDPGVPVYFMACFESIGHTAYKFDLVEGETGTWNFFGIQLFDPYEGW